MRSRPKQPINRPPRMWSTAGVSALLLFSSLRSEGGEKSRLVSNLEAGRKQTVVAYGTSLTAGGAWVEQLSAELGRRFPGQVTVINSGQGGQYSGWGVSNLQSRVLDKQPDAVFIEFSINDAYLPYSTTVAQARSNLETMADRILASKASCEIILMAMNPPIREHLAQRPKIEVYNQMYREVAAQRHFLLIDHYPNWQKILKTEPQRFNRYVPDGIHPNAEGCQAVITPSILHALGMEPAAVDVGLSPGVALQAGADPIKDLGPTVWLKADAGIAKDADSQVNKWADQSGHGNDAVSGTVLHPPKLVEKAINGLPALEFSWSQLFAPALTSGAVTIVAVVKCKALEENKPETTYLSTRVGVGDSGFEMEVSDAGMAFLRRYKDGSQGAIRQTQPQSLDTWFLASATFAAADCSIAVNGGVPVTVATVYQPSTAEKLSIGFKTGESGACNFLGQIAELIVFDRVLTAKDRVAIERHLAGKYKLPLPAGG